MNYCASRFHTVRRPTREVKIGSVGVGGANPIRLQSMTTSDTQDVEATVRQSIALAEVGCEIVRVTAPNIPAARCLREIRVKFSAAGFSHVPLVADIHFLPAAAMEAVEHVEKIRVNPGNYADKKRFAVREYSDADYQEELERLHEAFSPLVLRCKELGRSLRIGTNHGSLSDRIMNRYGDSPLGMVESALEFIRIARSHGFHDIILSMKASNPKVMIQTYRLLVARMDAENMRYPLHLGVTEAGDGEDGRIKSAIGIGSLLLDGIGDTIRVSLTEDSVYEIPVARALADKAMALWGNAECGMRNAELDDRARSPVFEVDNAPASVVQASHSCPSSSGDFTPRSAVRTPQFHDGIDPFQFSRRAVAPVELGAGVRISSEQPPRVIVPGGDVPADAAALLASLRAARPRLKDTPIEGLLLHARSSEDARRAVEQAPQLADEIACLVIELPAGAGLETLDAITVPTAPRIAVVQRFGAGSRAPLKQFLGDARARGVLPIVALSADSVAGLVEAGSEAATAPLPDASFCRPSRDRGITGRAEATHVSARSVTGPTGNPPNPMAAAATLRPFIVTLAPPSHGFASPAHAVGAWRRLAEELRRAGIAAPLWIRNTEVTSVRHEASFLSRLLEASVLTGSLLADGLGDLVSIETEHDLVRATKLAYNVLQGAGSRISKTEYVACPSCGRTLFDLQSTTQRIREKTGHLKGVKLAIMGCIVNGPGEMADADFGYVGGAPGRINLYVGKNCVQYNIPADEADQRLIDLIKAHGKWMDPEPAPAP